MSIIRVKNDVTAVLYDHDNDTHIAVRPGMEFDSDDGIVAQHAWAFESDADGRASRKRATAVEVASAEPGTKRNR
jgi:hypothetical protein